MTMMSKVASSRRLVGASLLGLIALAGLLSPATAQQAFKTPEEAVEALSTALRAGNRRAIRMVLGQSADEIVSSGDAVQDENNRKIFLSAYDEKHRVETKDDKAATLLIGPDDYPFAIPLAKKDNSWSFDVDAGRREVLARRIGRNELAAIQVCLAYVDAQYEYAEVTPKADDMAVYAQKVVSSAGKKDGLYWPSAEGQGQSPLGDAVAAASSRGYRVGSGRPFHGYYYRILTRQGPKAPGGAHDYIVGGKMIGGFALVAWPAEYGNSGVVTFVVNHDGNVYEKDLGENTPRIARRMTAYDPDTTWRKVAEIEVEKKQ